MLTWHQDLQTRSFKGVCYIQTVYDREVLGVKEWFVHRVATLRSIVTNAGHPLCK